MMNLGKLLIFSKHFPQKKKKYPPKQNRGKIFILDFFFPENHEKIFAKQYGTWSAANKHILLFFFLL